MNTYGAKTKNTVKVFSTFICLNRILRLFGLSCISCDGFQIKCSPLVFRAICITTILILFNGLCGYYLFPNFENGLFHFSYHDSVHLILILGFVQYIVDIHFVFKYGREFYLQYIDRFELFDRTIGIAVYEKIKRTINRICVFFILITFIGSFVEIIIWYLSYRSSSHMFYMLYYIYNFLNLLSALDFIANCTQVLFRLQSLEHKLKDFLCHVTNLPVPYNENNHSVVKSSNKNTNISAHTLTETVHRQNVVLLLNRCFLLLTDQFDYINIMFGLRILLSCVNFVVDTLLKITTIIKLFSSGIEVVTSGSRYLPISVTIVQIIVNSIVVFSIIHICERNYGQIERIIASIDGILHEKDVRPDILDCLKDLRNTIITRNMNFNAVKFFKLEYPILVSISSLLVTYGTILVQNVE
ncbi:uncharacterized protein LOC133320297 [Danaus plexippus]|uniref:uncharacterized protein LOC133320297 n=1 Tax=Danaus plexippus TaxID=13037 RepID=UPI002AAF5261|nr:uncharacterized protein LOC133320297 [Danaus plexippus]